VLATGGGEFGKGGQRQKLSPSVLPAGKEEEEKNGRKASATPSHFSRPDDGAKREKGGEGSEGGGKKGPGPHSWDFQCPEKGEWKKKGTNPPTVPFLFITSFRHGEKKGGGAKGKREDGLKHWTLSDLSAVSQRVKLGGEKG